MAEEEFVTVACKVPTNIRIGDHVIYGNTRVPPGESRKEQFLGAYVLTPNFPKKVWDKWYNDNLTSHMVVEQMIFADVDDAVRARLMPRAVTRQFGEIPYVSPNS